MDTWIPQLLQLFSLPEVGLSTVFVVALVSATLLPMGSEPAVFALVKLNPDLFWPAVLMATAGNTLGGAITWGLGYGVHDAVHKVKPELEHSASELKALQWLEHFGAKACLLSWLPVVGDPLCAVAGWLKLPFWPCVAYMAVGKFLRYVTMTAGLLWFFPGSWMNAVP
jgi:membrane protein YqaA with SNARE-associated domain